MLAKVGSSAKVPRFGGERQLFGEARGVKVRGNIVPLGLYLVFIGIDSVIIGIALGAKLRRMREWKKVKDA